MKRKKNINNQWKSLVNHRNALNVHDSHIHSRYLRLPEGQKQKYGAGFSGVETAETNKKIGGGIESLSDRWSTVGEDRVRWRQNQRDRRTEGSEDVPLCLGCLFVRKAGLNLMRLIHYGQTATALTSHMSSKPNPTTVPYSLAAPLPHLLGRHILGDRGFQCAFNQYQSIVTTCACII